MGSFKPVLDRVLISPEEAPKMSKGGVWVDAAKIPSWKGIVFGVGPSVVSVKEGDYVYYDPHSCGTVELGNKLFHVARDIPDGAIALVMDVKL